LERIIQKCTRLNPDDRYQTCAQLLYALAHYWIDDADWRKKQKKKIAFCILSASLTVLFGLGSLLFFRLADSAQTADYNHKVDTGQYVEAILNDPSKKTAYLALIQFFKRDSVLSVVAAAIKKKLEINQNIEALSVNHDGYTEVCYQIATAYWFYHDSDQATHSEATKWFSRVTAVSKEQLSIARRQDWEMANVFKKIGTFYQSEVIWNKEGGAEENAYSNYWNNITGLLELDSGENEFVSIKLMNEAVKESIQRKIKLNREGVTNGGIAKMIKSVRNQLNAIHAGELKEQKENLLRLCNAQLQLLMEEGE